MKIDDIKTPVSAVSGVGPKLTDLLSKLNVFTVGDLLKFFPRSYEDLTKKVPLKDFASSKIHTVARVIRHEWFGYGNMKTLKIIIDDGTASAQLICFNRKFLENTLVPGAIITVTGHFFVKYNSLQSTAFEAQVHQNFDAEKDDFKNFVPLNSKIVPIYPLTEGLTQKSIGKTILQAVSQYAKGLEDELPSELIQKRNLLSKQTAIQLIHNPKNMDDVSAARRTLAYEELFHFQKIILERSYKRRGTINENSGEKTQASDDTVTLQEFTQSLSPLQKKFLEQIPFELTDDQRNVIFEMDKEIDRSYMEQERVLNQLDRGLPPPVRPSFTMARLLQGDVGSGKTLVSLFICLRVISWKGQCALMAPTELLARQHAETTGNLLEKVGIRTAFLTGNLKAAGRNQLLKALKNGDIDIVVGTHALFSAQTVYKNLKLAVIDEQHRFGVMQRQAIIAKGRFEENGMTFEPNLLMMSATPIPQSLALTFFGDLDVSTIKTKPLGRKPITTYLVKEGNETNAYEAVCKELEKGRQAYFVYPAINSDYVYNSTEDEGLESGRNFKSAEKSFEHLKNHIYPQYKCALIHGKIDEEEQAQILHDFHDGKIQVLAATTVIEVGVDVPNATCMVIEQADYFGMAQLHQLRGRVGRGSEQSFCFLIYSKNISASGIERMKTLRQSTDGFYIAEQDLRTRGPGEINGTLQAGELEFSIANISRDKELMSQAREDAIQFITGQKN